MAQFNLRAAIPRQMEITKEFQAEDLSDSELKALRDRVLVIDLEVDLRNILGRLIDQVADVDASWGKFKEFVQKQPSEPEGTTSGQFGSTLQKGELTTRLRLTAK